MIAKLQVQLSVAALLSLAIPHTFADTVNADVQNSQNQAAIATANATAMNAQAAAQQALLATQLTNQKTEISNIQSALSAPDPSKLRAISSVTAPTVNASYYRILSDKLDTWLKDADGTPITDTNNCSPLFLWRASLLTSIQTFKATDAKLFALWKNLADKSKALDTDWNAHKKPAKIELKESTYSLLVPLAGVGAVADLVGSFASAAKQQTAIGTQSLSNANKIVTAAVSAAVSAKLPEREFYDPDSSVDFTYTSMGSDAACDNDANEFTVNLKKLAGKASCVVNALEKAHTVIATVKLPPVDPKAKSDPDAALRTEVDSLTKLVTLSTSDFQSLYLADSGSGVIPFNLATQGEIYNQKLSGDKACVLTITTSSSDADTVVRDGTFSSYKLSIATTTTISWSVASPQGQIKKAGFKPLTTTWENQNLEGTESVLMKKH